MSDLTTMADTLSNLEPFAGITRKELRRDVLPVVRLCKQKEGGCFYHSGDDCEAVYFIVEGEVLLYRYSSSYKKVVLARSCAGEFFGEQTLLSGKRTHASWAEALTDTTCVEITRSNLSYLRQRYPSLTLNMYEREQSKLGQALQAVRSIRLESILLRVVRALLLTYTTTKNPVLEDLGHQEIADIVGTNRETVTNILHQLSQEGLITKGRMQITLNNVAGLQAMLSEG